MKYPQVHVIFYAGRTGGGDFKWQFDDRVDDTATAVNAALKAAIVGYATSLVSVQGIGTVGIGENAFPSTVPVSTPIRLGPNPVATMLTISSDMSINGLKMYSLSGVLVKAVEAGIITVDVEGIESGTYLAVIGTDKGAVTKLIIKK
jgi:hypothetical protein